MSDVGGLQLPKDKRVLYGGAALVFIVIGVVYYRSKKTAAAASSTVSNANAPIDSQTGYPVGSPEDNAALAAMSANSAYGSVPGYGYSSPSQTYSTSPTGFNTNGEWAQAAEDYLANQTQGDATTIAAALGKYITGQSVTTDQQNIIDQAIAFEGLPPVGGTNGYPPSVKLIPTPTGGNGGGGGGAGGGGGIDPSTGLPKPGTVIYGPWMVQNGQTIQAVSARFGIQPSQIQGAWTVGNVVKIPWLVKWGQNINSVAAVYEIPASQLASTMTY